MMIISLNRINQLQMLFIKEKRCVFFAVRTESLSNVYIRIGFRGLKHSDKFFFHGVILF